MEGNRATGDGSPVLRIVRETTSILRGVGEVRWSAELNELGDRVTTYRLSELQRARAKRYFVRTFGFSAVVQIGFGLVLHRWDSALAYPAFGAVLVLSFMATARFSFTELSEEGIRSRAFLFARRSCPWTRVADIGVWSNGRTTTVRVHRADGTRFLLGAPVTGGVMADPMFEAKVEEITNAWNVHAPAERRQHMASRRAQLWRRIGLWTAATILWGATPFLLLGAVISAYDNGSIPAGRTLAVVTGVNTAYGVPVYELEALSGYTFPASEVTVSPTEASCAEMADGTRVGDRVTLVYPPSDPSQMEDVRLEPGRWHDALPTSIVAVVGGAGSFLVRRRLTRAHRLRRG